MGVQVANTPKVRSKETSLAEFAQTPALHGACASCQLGMRHVLLR
jgi:hypothetical protein